VRALPSITRLQAKGERHGEAAGVRRGDQLFRVGALDRLIEAARKRGRNGARDACAILLAYRHGLRAAELCALRWSQIDLRQGRLHVNRAKGGCASVHPLHGPELRALRPLQGRVRMRS